jgi:beta-N-acetylhexosaminidase
MSGVGPLIVDVGGHELTAADRERLAHPLVGQVILFARNFDHPAQLGRLCAQIHALRDPPLLILADQEGGRVQRFRTGFTVIPPMADLGRLASRDAASASRIARAVGLVIATELRARGVDLTLAPVLDLEWGRSGVIGERAFARDPAAVARLAADLVQGFALAGMACCGKHFPGHGWAEADSHSGAVVDERPLETILAHDVAPYRALGAGLAAVMPSHVIYAAVDPQPAGFSPRWLKTILRDELGFDGAVISDDLSMLAAAAAGPIEARAAAALAAGCDLVPVCNDEAGAERVLDTLRWAAPAAFAARRQRLVPRGPPPADIEADLRYRRARDEVVQWIEGKT